MKRNGWRLDLLKFVIILCSILFQSCHCSSPNFFGNSDDFREPVEKVNRKVTAWEDIKKSVSHSRVDEFKRLLNKYKTNNFINDKDSGYFETLYDCATKRPRDMSHQFLQIMLKFLCTKNIVHILPEIIGDLDLEGLLMVRKYCPVGGHQMYEFLEMFEGLHDDNPLSKYLLANWEEPHALQFTKSEYAISPLIADYPERYSKPRKFDGRGLMLDNFQFIQPIDRASLFLEYHNVLAGAEGMAMDAFAEIIPVLLGSAGKDGSEKQIGSQLAGMLPGSFAVAVLIDDVMHIWKRGSCTFVLMSFNESADVEEIVYPLGNSFKEPSGNLEYSQHVVGPNSVLVYCSGLVTEEIQMYDILGITMYYSDDPDSLKKNFERYIENMKDVNESSETGLVMRLYHITRNMKKMKEESSVPRERLRHRAPPAFKIYSASEDDWLSRSESGGTYTFGLGGIGTSFDLKSEASYDDDDDYERLLLSSDEEGDETLFERRRWWFDSSSGERKSSIQSDNSMSRDFFLPSFSFLNDPSYLPYSQSTERHYE